MGTGTGTGGGAGEGDRCWSREAENGSARGASMQEVAVMMAALLLAVGMLAMLTHAAPLVRVQLVGD